MPGRVDRGPRIGFGSNERSIRLYRQSGGCREDCDGDQKSD